MCISEKWKIKPCTEARGMLATRKTSEAPWSVYMVGFQQAIIISRNFISRRLWLILTVTVYVCYKLGLLFDLVGEGGGMYVLVKCRVLWESSARSVSVKIVDAQWRSMSAHDVEWQWFCPWMLFQVSHPGRVTEAGQNSDMSSWSQPTGNSYTDGCFLRRGRNQLSYNARGKGRGR